MHICYVICLYIFTYNINLFSTLFFLFIFELSKLCDIRMNSYITFGARNIVPVLSHCIKKGTFPYFSHGLNNNIFSFHSFYFDVLFFLLAWCSWSVSRSTWCSWWSSRLSHWRWSTFWISAVYFLVSTFTAISWNKIMFSVQQTPSKMV